MTRQRYFIKELNLYTEIELVDTTRTPLEEEIQTAADVDESDITDGSVTLAKLANLATDKLIGRETAGTGVPEAIACTAAGRALLAAATALAQRLLLRQRKVTTLAIVSDEVAINADTTELGILGAAAAGFTLKNPTGTPTDGQLLALRLTTAASQTITHDSAFAATADVALLAATTGGGDTDILLYEWNAADSLWYNISKTNTGA